MKKLKFFFALAIILSSKLSPASIQKKALNDPYRLTNQSFQLARKENKLLLVFVGSDVCLESRAYLRSIAKDILLFKLIEDSFVFRILDYDLNPALAVRYALPTLPGVLVLDSKGQIYFGSTRTQTESLRATLLRLNTRWAESPQSLQKDLEVFKNQAHQNQFPSTLEEILDATMDLPNHLSLDLGRAVLTLPRQDESFLRYNSQLLEWIKSENFDFVEGSYFMPRGYCTYHAEGKYSFFNFKLQETLIDFYSKTQNPKLKYAFLKSLKILKRDLFLDQHISFSTGYGSKKYFRLPLKKRLLHYPPSPRRSDLALSQILYLKILYKVSQLQKKGLLVGQEIEFLQDHLRQRHSLFSKILHRYQRKDGFLSFTAQKRFINLETQVEFFALLQWMEAMEPLKSKKILAQMETLNKNLKRAFLNPQKLLFSDLPMKSLRQNQLLYAYPLYQVRENCRLLLFFDFLYRKTGRQEYQNLSSRVFEALKSHNLDHPERFYWLDWYRRLQAKKKPH
jgi:hypothetical protein